VNWNNAPGGTNTYTLEIGATGTPEPCTVVTAGPGTAVSGAASGTLTISCIGAHAAGFTVASTSGGIQEALILSNGTKRVYAIGNFPTYATIWLVTAVPNWLEGSINPQGTSGSEGSTVSFYGAGNAIQLADTGGSEPQHVGYLDIYNLSGFGTNALYLFGNSNLQVESLWIVDFAAAGIETNQCYGGWIRDSSIYGATNGIYVNQSNAIRLTNNFTAASTGAGVLVSAPSLLLASTNIVVDGLVSETDRIGIGLTYAYAPTVAHSYIEAPTLYGTWFSTGVLGVTYESNFTSSAVAGLELAGVDGLLTGKVTGNTFSSMSGFAVQGNPYGLVIDNTNTYQGGAYNSLSAQPHGAVLLVGCTYASTTCTVHFAPVFAAAPVCTANDQTAAAPVGVVSTAGSVAFTGGTGAGATDVITGTCTGN
jgi:hypothetical protein